jgi:hypothetical protein
MDMINRSAIVVKPAQPFLDLAASGGFDKRPFDSGGPETQADHLLVAGIRQQGEGTRTSAGDQQADL